MSDTGFDINSLTPEEIQQILEILGGQQAPGAFGGNYGVSMDQAGLDQAGYSRVDIPTLNAKGNVEPFELSQAQARLNLGQDQTSSLDDLMFAALGGPGAFGPDAFTPQYDFGTPVNMKGQRKAQSYVDRGGYQGYIAHAIMVEGKNPEEAAREALALAANTKEDDPSLSPEKRKLLISLKQTLPSAQISGSATNAVGPPVEGGTATSKLPKGREGEAVYDTQRVLNFANSLFDDISSDPTFVYQDPETGNYYDKTPEQAMIKTDAMKAFDKAGLPYGNASYTDQDYINRAIQASTGRGAEDQQSAEQDWLDQMTKMQGERELSTGRQKQAATQMDQLRPFMDQLQNPQPWPGTPSSQPGQTDPLRQPPRGLPSVQVPPTAYAQGLADVNYRQQQAGRQPLSTPPSTPSEQPRYFDPNSQPTAFGQIWNALGPGGGGQAAAAGGPPTETALRQPPRTFTPQTEPMIYVDKDGNIVGAPEASPLRTLRDYTRAGSPTKRPVKAEDMAQLQKQYDTEKQANLDYYKQRDEAQKNDPRLARMHARIRAERLAEAGRSPLRDALMQRQLALRAMGYPGS
jgi:hypothetical protein